MHASVKLELYSVTVVAFLALTLSAIAQNPTAGSSAPSAVAQVPRLIRFSGVAKNESGKPMTGTVGVTFLLYKDAQGGAPLWLETQNVQADATGHYTALLGSASADGVPLAIFTSAEAQWVAGRISGQAEQPRVLLMSVPYALKAVDAQTLGGLPASAFMPANLAATSGKAGASPTAPAGSLPPAGVTGKGTKDFVPLWTSGTALGNSLIFQTGGNLGVGTKTPKANLDLVGTGKIGIRATVPGTQAAISGVATATSGGTTGVAGISADPSGNGVFGINNAKTGGIGVIGSSNATSGQTSGVFGVAKSKTTGAAGVFGSELAKTGLVYGVGGFAASTSTGATGVAGFEAATTGQVFGVTGSTNSTTNFSVGVSGIEGATTGAVFGVAGETPSTTDGAAAVSGFESATTGAVTGVSGATSSTSGTGVDGNATATSGPTIGVRGVATSPAGAAGLFINLSGGTSQVLIGSGANAVQVFNVDASGNGFYAGNLNVTGKLTKGSGSFKIDHPLDPANKYLSHSFVESPDMMNVYNGNITTDKHGIATVALPCYFEALNADFRYQLTVIGQFAQAIVQQEIKSNQFTIKTNKPGVKVSWQVTGIRHDAYADANRIPVEEDKPAAEQGYYLHPEVFGQPASKSAQAAGHKPASGSVLAEAGQP
jgi:trimeric autotransporter adhesin